MSISTNCNWREAIWLALPVGAAVLDRVLDVEEDSHILAARLACVNEHGPATQEVPVAFENDVYRGVQERMPRADERGERLAGNADELLVEGHALVSGQDGLVRANLPIAVAQDRGYVRDLVAARLPFPNRAPRRRNASMKKEAMK